MVIKNYMNTVKDNDLFIKEQKLTEDQLKSLYQKLMHDILTPPTYLINLLTYINWRIEHFNGIYYKSKLLDANLSKNSTQIVDNDTITIHDQIYHFSPYLVPHLQRTLRMVYIGQPSSITSNTQLSLLIK